MGAKFAIQSSDPELLAKVVRIAEDFVQPYRTEDVVGIVFLGAITRGYFDRHSDIDIAIFKKKAADFPLKDKFYTVEGLEVQVWLSDYEDELTSAWDMPKRWTYSQGRIDFDPQGKIARLLAEKVPLQPDEKRWMVMTGFTLSEWYANRMTQMWVERGSLTSAHHMFHQALIYFYDMLFGLNDELVADMKWRQYWVEQMPRLPHHFRERIQKVMTLHAFTLDELERRRQAFMSMWEEMRPEVEELAGMTFEEMLHVV